MALGDKLKEIIDAAPAKVEGLETQLGLMQESIDAETEKQNEFKDLMDKLRIDVEEYIMSVDGVEWISTYDNYYSGSLNSDANLTDWKAFADLIDYASKINNSTFSIPGNNTSEFSIGQVVYFRESDIVINNDNLTSSVKIISDSISSIDLGENDILESNRKDITTSINSVLNIDVSNISKYSLPSKGKITGVIYNDIDDITEYSVDMIDGNIPNNLQYISELIYSKGGFNWDNPDDLSERFSEFNFVNDQVHHEYGETGTYGTKARIKKMKQGLSLIENNLSKAKKEAAKLARYSS